MATNVLVFVERRDEEVKRASLEAVGVARRLAATGSVIAVTIGVLGCASGGGLDLSLP